MLRLKLRCLYLFLLLLPFFGGCSWQEYFIIVNETNFPITINYTLNESNNGFGTFDTEPAVYQLNPSGDIDWSSKFPVIDSDSSLYNIGITLPAKSVIIMGSLTNDHYENHNQKTTNDRVNLKNITIAFPDKNLEISSENFEKFFKKRNGNIEYRINSIIP